MVNLNVVNVGKSARVLFVFQGKNPSYPILVPLAIKFTNVAACLSYYFIYIVCQKYKVSIPYSFKIFPFPNFFAKP